MKARFLFTNMAKAKVHDLGKMGLRELIPAYFTYPAIVVYLVLSVIGTGLAIRYGALAIPVRTSLAVALVVVMYPVVWYLLHRFILHSRFLYRFAVTARLWKRIHYDHHQDPYRLDVLFSSLTNTLPTMAILTLPTGYWIAGNWSGAATAFTASLLTTCVYEFCHCIQHLNFQPKNGWLKRIKRLHMAHHFHNETGNFGIISFWVDTITGTAHEDMTAQPRSPTVFNLGYDDDEARRYPWVAALSPPGRRRLSVVSE